MRRKDMNLEVIVLVLSFKNWVVVGVILNK